MSSSFLSCESWVEIRLCPMFRTSCRSATLSSWSSSRWRMRRRVGSEMTLSELIIDIAMNEFISTYQDLLIRTS